jgi:hypothetical protein
VKLIGGGGFRGSNRTTLDSTLGGGRKLFLPTLRKKYYKNRNKNIEYNKNIAT